MLLASGALEAPELVTAWQAPVAFSHDPSEWLPRGSGETDGSVAVAAERAVPVQVVVPSHCRAAPATEAAEGPLPRRAVLVAWPSAAKFWAAPGPVEAAERDWT
jgi:hypothetical protein